MDDFLLAMDKCGHQQESSVYKNASRQLVLTYNDFAMDCFKSVQQQQQLCSTVSAVVHLCVCVCVRVTTYRRRYFSEAVTLLNKAIKEEKNEKGLYLNRGGKKKYLRTQLISNDDSYPNYI